MESSLASSRGRSPRTICPAERRIPPRLASGQCRQGRMPHVDTDDGDL